MLRQLIRFGIVGIIAAVTDVSVLVLFREVLCFDVLPASAISFCVSVTVNYILSMKYVFRGKACNRIKEFILFTALSIGGLCLNQIILWVGISFTTLHYLIVKLAAMALVPVYNFVTRKLFLEDKKA